MEDSLNCLTVTCESEKFQHHGCFIAGKSVTLFSILIPPAVDLLEGMLLLDPETRLTAKQGLTHPYLAEYHDPECEPDSDPYDDSFESLELAVGEWKSKSAQRLEFVTGRL